MPTMLVESITFSTNIRLRGPYGDSYLRSVTVAPGEPSLSTCRCGPTKYCANTYLASDRWEEFWAYCNAHTAPRTMQVTITHNAGGSITFEWGEPGVGVGSYTAAADASDAEQIPHPFTETEIDTTVMVEQLAMIWRSLHNLVHTHEEMRADIQALSATLNEESPSGTRTFEEESPTGSRKTGTDKRGPRG